jgi:diaminohydroxyphosphoribosylaminopyrimidine deaminase / 5-amino-6-(5-phosphoribosylamino)uracil reductase
MENSSQRAHMERALVLASAERTHPNPQVGAVVVASDGTVAGEGAHRGPGTMHAEAIALAAAGERARGGTIVTTLEPCDHQGQTPPCTEAIIAQDVLRVIVGAVDPDARVSGRGIARLQAAGVDVIIGVLAEAVEAADPAYFHHRRTGRPRVTLKAALTLDGQTAAVDGSSQWITGPGARHDSHLLRASADAVVVGAGTLIADDPALDVRIDGYDGPQPRPVVIAGTRALPEGRQLWERNPIVVTTARREGPGEPLIVPGGELGLPDLNAALVRLGQMGLLEILVEGGSVLATSLWQADLVDRAIFYIGGTVAGGAGRPVFASIWPTLDAAKPVEIIAVEQLGPDLKVTFLTHVSRPTSHA